jgi:hypothetical protein
MRALRSQHLYLFVFVLLELGAVAVFWCFDAPPFMDFPGHAGVMALRLRYPQSAFLQQYFVVTNEISGYPLFRFAGDLLARIFGPLIAMRLISTIPVVALPLAIRHARRRLTGDDGWPFVFAALILSFGYMTQMGLSPFLVAFPVLVWACTEWMVLIDRGGTPAAEIKVAILAMLVAMIHGYAFAALAVLMLTAALSGTPVRPRIERLRVLIPACAFLALGAWISTSSALPAGAVDTSEPIGIGYGSILDKLGLLTNPTLTTRTGIDLAIGIALWFAIIGGLVASHIRVKDGPRRQQMIALRNGAIVLLVLFVVLPHRVRQFDAVDSRLLPIVLLVALMAIEPVPTRLRRAIAAAVGAAAAVFVGLELYAMQIFQAEAAGYREVLARIPAGARLLYIPLEADSRIFISHPFVHYDKLAIVERPVLPTQFHFHHASGIFPTARNPMLRLPATHKASNFKRLDWPGYRLTDWDYVLIRRFPDAPAPHVPAALAPELHRGGWWLYRSAAGAETGASL